MSKKDIITGISIALLALATFLILFVKPKYGPQIEKQAKKTEREKTLNKEDTADKEVKTDNKEKPEKEEDRPKK